ncbi:MAG: TIGR04219 family outer membrane beta-barrel protein [Pseudomonadales bacterium]
MADTKFRTVANEALQKRATTAQNLGATLLLATLVFNSHQAHAADFAARIGVDSWSQDLGGSIDSTNTDIGTVSVEDDLGFGSETGLSYYLLLEHPLGVVPNVKLQYTELNSDETNDLQRDITYDNVTFTANQTIRSALDLNHVDLSLYWQPVQGRFDVSLGFTIRVLDGSFTVRSQDNQSVARQSVDEALPLPYAHIGYEFGNTGLSVDAEVKAAAFEGDKFIDSNLRLGWESKIGLGLELGYRSITLEADDLDVTDSNGNPDFIDLDIEAKGLYFGAFYEF